MKALIIEDELRSQKLLQQLLEISSPGVEVIGMATTVTDGLMKIKKLEPDIIFLDVQLADGVGFDILERLGSTEAHVVFTTAYDQYAIKAFEFSAVDYLVKPIDIDQIKRAVDKCYEKQNFKISNRKIEGLLRNLNLKNNEEPMLSISTAENIEFIKIRDIIHCEAQGAYTYLYLEGGQNVLISKVIKDLENLLSEYNFFRVHQSHLVNIAEIRKYWKKHNQLELSDGSRVSIARTRKANFLEKVGKIKI